MTTGRSGQRRAAGRRRAAPRRGRRAAEPRPRRTRTAGRPEADPTTQLTAAGGLSTIGGCTLVGALLDGLFGGDFGLGTWFGFVVGCVTATIKIRPRDLLVLVVSTPLAFLVAIVVAQTVRLWGSDGWLRSELVGLATALSEGAPWLFVGTGTVVAIAWARGLRDNIRELRAETRGERPRKDPEESSLDDE